MEQQETDIAKIDTAVLRQRLKKDISKNSHKRQFERFDIFAVGTMTIMDNSQQLDGVVDEVSAGGLRFRPASVFIMERKNEAISLQLGGFQISGIIRATRADGYGVQILDQLTDEQLSVLIEKYQV